MNRRDENQITMFNVVVALMEENISLLEPITGLKAAYDEFKSKNSQLHEVLTEQDARIMGAAKEKERAKSDLAQVGATIAGGIRAYAVAINDLVLRDAMDYSESDLKYRRDEYVRVSADAIREKAEELGAALVPYGVDSAMVTHFISCIQEYGEKITATTAAKNEKKERTGRIREMMGEINYLLDERLDPNMKVMEEREHVFYLRYRNARQVIDLGLGLRKMGKLRLVVKGTSGEPVAGVTIRASSKPSRIKTDESGLATIRLNPGTYPVRLSKEDYKTQVANDVEVREREVTLLEVVMEAVK
jgi:ribosomal protein L7/L12